MTDGTVPGPERIIDRRYRARFLLRICGIVAAGAALLHLSLMAVFSRSLGGDYGSVHSALRHLSEFLWPVLALPALAFVVAVCTATAFVCVRYLHKVAGPLYRMERAFDECDAGGPVRPVFFRAGDQVAAVADAFNGFVAALREDRQRWLAAMDRADRLCLLDAAGCRAERVKALEEIAARLERYR